MPRRLNVDPADIVVFLGPSLPVEEARRTLGARYLGPARCGDVLRALRLRPRVIAVVDGLFAATPAVWHKEILLALDRGVAVFGASSMGALRAAELAPFGMVGIGKIFEAYRDGTYTDDDEVALVHGPAAFGYRALSDAMVNIRATVTRAVESGIIQAVSGDRVVARAKSTFFEQRSLHAAIEQAWADDPLAEEPMRLREFVERGGYVDQKRLDALALLRHLAGHRPALPNRKPGAHRTSLVLKLHRDVMIGPFESPEPDLPREEAVAHEALELGRLYPLLFRLAQLMALVHASSSGCREEEGGEDAAGVFSRDDFGLGPIARSRRWAAARDLDANGYSAFVDRLGVIRRALDAHSRSLGRHEAGRRDNEFVLSVLRLDEVYRDLRPAGVAAGTRTTTAVLRAARRAGGTEFGLYRRIARLWAIADEKTQAAGIQPLESPQSLSDEFRRKRHLERRKDALAWQQANDLNHAGYVDLVMKDARLSLVLNAPQPFVVGFLHASEPACWLLDAIRLTGLYGRAAARLKRSRGSIQVEPFGGQDE
jgi:hypothetical protein